MVNSSISKRISFILLFVCLVIAIRECSNRISAGSEAAKSSMNTKQSDPDAIGSLCQGFGC